METVGFVGVGKIGLPISENLIKSGYRVLGYRRGSLEEFEKVGGVRGEARRPRSARRPTSCSPACRRATHWTRWYRGRRGSPHRRVPARSSIELGSHPVPDKERQIAPLAAKGAVFLDGEVSGTPGMVSARKAVIYLAGDAEARQEGRAGGRRLRRFVPVLRQVRRREPGQARQQSAGGDQHRRHRRGDGARPQGRRRRRSDDQGDRHRQRRLDPVRDPRALDGAAALPARAGHGAGAAALLRHDRRFRRRRRRGDAAARPGDASSTTSSSRWDLPRRTAPRWSTSSPRCRAQRRTERNSRRSA